MGYVPPAGGRLEELSCTLIIQALPRRLLDSLQLAFRNELIELCLAKFQNGLDRISVGGQHGHPIVENLGEIIGQVNGRRGNVLGMEMRPGNAQAVRAMVPLAEMFGYATELRSATQGRGVFSMEFDHYQPVAESVMQEMLK